MTEAQAWLAQVESDWETAELIAEGQQATRRKHSLRCQEIAKYQQIAEKAINVWDAVLRERGIIRGRTKAEHYPRRMLNRLMAIPLDRGSGAVQYIVRHVLTKSVQPDIYDLCTLAPHLPAAGEGFQRNTEYPYNVDKDWTAPASDDSFSLEEVERFRQLAGRLRDAAHRVFTMV